MWDLDDDHGYWRGRRSHSSGYFSDSEWLAATLSLTAGEIGIIAHFYCVSFLLKLIQLKTPLSYAEYMDTQNKMSNNTSGNIFDSDNSSGIPATTINVYNTPPNQNQLAFLGYDKDGHPIYAGNNQYRMVNPPVVNQPYVNQPYVNQPNVNQNNNIISNKNIDTNNKNTNNKNINTNNNVNNNNNNKNVTNNNNNIDNSDNLK
jgi:hypothetical protein